MKFGLMFFAASEDALVGDKYRLVTESARFGDRNGFASVWVPERHFTKFGSLYPNPAVLQAALAMATERIALRAGSVVAPLHHPLRIAEEWSVVDNLSGGRVGISFAPGWNPDDFAFFPERYANRYEHLASAIATVRSLWRGESLEVTNGTGKTTNVRLYPTPVQRELPVWVTAASSPQSYARAGELGANLLTHLLDQGEDELARKIRLYREARERAGFEPAAGIVSVMLHTFVGEDAKQVRDQARGPFCNYIRNNIGLLNGLARSRGQEIDVRSMSPRDLGEFVEFLYERFADSRGLIGTPETCLDLVARLEQAGVDEIACLLDFGPDADLILSNLPHLARLKNRYEASRTKAPAQARFNPAAVQARCTEEIAGEAFHNNLRGYGIEIGPRLQGIERIWRRDGEALGKVQPNLAGPYTLDPAFLDTCSRVLAAALPSELLNGARRFYWPAGFESLRVESATSQPAWSHARVTRMGSEIEGDISVYGMDGQPLFDIGGLRLRSMESEPATERETGYQLYRRHWIAAPEMAASAAPTGEWLIFTDRGGVAEQCASLIARAGGSCRVAESVDAVIDGALPQRVVYLGGWGRDLLRLIQRLARDPASATKLWIATSGAMSVLEGDASKPVEAALWGIGRTVAVEHPEFWGGLVDLDPESSPEASARELLAVVLAGGQEDMLAWRGGNRYTARLRADSEPPGARLALADDATYLVTGGTGGLGLRLTHWLIERGARHIALVGRRPVSTSLPQEARFLRADVANERETAEALREVRRSMPPLRGIFHLAGTLDDGLLESQDWVRFAKSAAGKMDGAWNLHQATLGDPLDYFVMFSSMASLVPMPGQGSYAAANSALDALAWMRRAEGRAGLSINWGPWAEIGHAATEYGRSAHAKLAQLGIEALAPDEALAALERLMAAQVVQAAVTRIDWDRFFRFDPAARDSAFLSEMGDARIPAARPTELTEHMRAMPSADRKPFLIEYLAGLVRQTLKLKDATAIPRRQGLFDLGLDSIVALELKTRLESSLGCPLRATLLFAYPNLESLAGYLLTDALTFPPEPVPVATSVPDSLSEDELAALIAEEIERRP